MDGLNDALETRRALQFRFNTRADGFRKDAKKLEDKLLQQKTSSDELQQRLLQEVAVKEEALQVRHAWLLVHANCVEKIQV